MVMKHFNQVVFRFMSAGLLLAVMLATSSCTREIPVTKTSIKLGLPSSSDKLGSLSATQQLGHVIINVSGPGIGAPVYLAWDDKESGAAAPTAFTVEVPTGSARLFQALLVFEDTTNGAMSFYYGDILQDVNSGTDSVTVMALALPNTASGDGQVTGRFKVGSSFYTGHVAMRFAPASGRPPMVIEGSEIFAGWFSVFGLDGIAFNYTLEDGTELFGGPLDVGSNSFGADTRTAMVTVPNHWESHGGPGDPREPRRTSKNIFGWFGDSGFTTGKKVCYYNGSTPIPYAYVNQSTSDMTEISWSAALVAAGGGEGDSSAGSAGIGMCIATGTPSRFNNVLSIDPREVAHHDGTLGFRGPFQRYTYSGGGGGNGFLDHTLIGSTVTVRWSYLPDVGEVLPARGVAGSDLFMRIIPVGATGDYARNYRGQNDGIMCAALPALGFSLKADVSHPTDMHSFSLSTPELTAYTAANSSDRVQYVLCPYSLASGAKTYFRTGLDYGGMSGASGGPALMSPTALTVDDSVSLQLTASFSFSGDSNVNSTAVLWYCNDSMYPGCVPTSYSNTSMTKAGNTYSGTPAAFSPGESGNTIKFQVLISDPDGYTNPSPTSALVMP